MTWRCSSFRKHCGFVVNVDNATCKDILHLISVIQKVVKDNHGGIRNGDKVIGRGLDDKTNW